MRLLPLLLLVACGNAAEKVTSKVVGTTVETVKGVGTGVSNGLQEGRKGAASADGSKTLSSAEEVGAAIDLGVYQVIGRGSTVEVVVAITNKTGDALHLLGLHDQGGAQLVDKEGFATPITKDSPGQLGSEIQVPPNAKVKASLFFEGNAETAASVRLWGRDVPVPAGALQATEVQPAG